MDGRPSPTTDPPAGAPAGPSRGATIVFRVLLVLVALGTLKAMATILFRREAFVAAFPGATPGSKAAAFCVAAVGGLAALGALFRARGAVALLVAGSALTLGMDAWLRAPADHVVVAAILTALVPLFAWRARQWP